MAVGPLNIGPSAVKGVPSRARNVSRFFATLWLAPAALILRRRSVTSWTVKPDWRVITTRLASLKVRFSSTIASVFSERFTAFSNYGPTRRIRVEPAALRPQPPLAVHANEDLVALLACPG